MQCGVQRGSEGLRSTEPELAAIKLEDELLEIAGCVKESGLEGRLMLGMTFGLAQSDP